MDSPRTSDGEEDPPFYKLIDSLNKIQDVEMQPAIESPNVEQQTNVRPVPAVRQIDVGSTPLPTTPRNNKRSRVDSIPTPEPPPKLRMIKPIMSSNFIKINPLANSFGAPPDLTSISGIVLTATRSMKMLNAIKGGSTTTLLSHTGDFPPLLRYKALMASLEDFIVNTATLRDVIKVNKAVVDFYTAVATNTPLIMFGLTWFFNFYDSTEKGILLLADFYVFQTMARLHTQLRKNTGPVSDPASVHHFHTMLEICERRIVQKFDNAFEVARKNVKPCPPTEGSTSLSYVHGGSSTQMLGTFHTFLKVPGRTMNVKYYTRADMCSDLIKSRIYVGD